MKRQKLLQLELHLKGRPKQVFNVLPKELVVDFSTAVDSLRKRLAPIRKEALLSAQLIKWKQKPMESVNQYAQNFETSFNLSYGRRSGMNQASKDHLKRDFFRARSCDEVARESAPICKGLWRLSASGESY